ncbi:hypothetical protein A6P39_042815 (plasmid) [Streptomyces sp. FXJ1.172]|uniref:hypothetical protein n=1 Tax=Streptomyces sp. FXJ1.172 TaxID=710705 RepID=UPI0023DD63B2|nr:hypothetical protein [Streptomyces sp. FXJ1.172]WEP00898.1 hypothetical protein A6P39_042815 [Streptomyces sp. FXJ1.172]
MIRRGGRRRAARAARSGSTDLVVSSGGPRIHLVHRGWRPPARLAELAGWLAPAPPEQTTVLVGTPLGDGGVDTLCERLAPVLDESRAAGVRVLRLVMSAGADEGGGQHSVARRVCERWGFDVFATAGIAVVVPDGTLFSPELPDAPGGWWHFSDGVVPQRVGTRLPVPAWESALERVDRDVAPGYVVEPVPAGLVVRSAEARASGVDALRYAVPPDPRRPLLLVGAPGTPPVSPDALAGVIVALPGSVRRSLRLLSPDGHDMLTAGQAVADLLGTEIHVANGVPMLVDGAAPDDVTVSSWLLGGDGEPSWRPYVAAARCLPATNGRPSAPLAVEYRAPAAGLRDGDEPGVWLLDRRWQVTATPAGLWVGQRGYQPPPAASARPVDPEVTTVDLGLPSRALDDSFWPALDRLFGALDSEVRVRAMVHVHGVLGSRGGDSLRRLAVRHEFCVMPQRPRSDADSAAPQAPLPSPLFAGQDDDEPDEGVPGAGAVTRPTAPVAAAKEPFGTVTSCAGDVPAPGPPAAGKQTATETAPVTESVLGSVPAPRPTATVSAPSVPAAYDPQRVAAGTTNTTADGGSAGPREAEPARAEDSARTASAGAAGSLAGRLSTPLGPTAPDRAAERPMAAGASRAPKSAGPARVQERTAHATETPPSGTAASPGPGARPGTEPTAGTTTPSTGSAVSFSGDLLVRPSHRSTPADREALREFLGARWDRHTSAVSRALTRTPGLRGEEVSASSADLAAVHAYLTDADSEQLRASLAAGDAQVLTFLRCLASGLRRLPSYRGVALRTGTWPGTHMTTGTAGTDLGEAVPVRALAVDRAHPLPTADHCLIWSATGRRTKALTDSDTSPGCDDLLFAPGARFRLLEVGRQGTATVALLRELPEHASTDPAEGLIEADLAVLDRLHALQAASTVTPGRPDSAASRTAGGGPFPASGT